MKFYSVFLILFVIVYLDFLVAAEDDDCLDLAKDHHGETILTNNFISFLYKYL